MIRQIFFLLLLLLTIQVAAQRAPTNARAFRPDVPGSMKGTNAAGQVDDVFPAIQTFIPNRGQDYLVGEIVLFEGNAYEVLVETQQSPTEASGSWKLRFSLYATSASFSTTTDQLDIGRSDGSTLTATLRDVVLSPTTFVSATGFSSTPQKGNLRKTYGFSTAASSSYASTDQVYLLPGDYVSLAGFSGLTKFHGGPGSHLLVFSNSPWSMTGSNSYDYSTDYMTLYKTPFVTNSTNDHSLQLRVRRLVSLNTVNYSLAMHQTGKSCVVDIDYWEWKGSGPKLWFRALKGPAKIHVGTIIDDVTNPSPSISTKANFTLNAGSDANASIDAHIETYVGRYVKGSNAQGESCPFMVGGYSSTTNGPSGGKGYEWKLKIDSYLDYTTGDGRVSQFHGTGYRVDYLNIDRASRSGVDIASIAIQPIDADDCTYDVAIGAGNLRSPVVVQRYYNDNDYSATGTTVNITFGDVQFRDEVCVGLDPATSVTGDINVHAENIVQTSDEAMIKIGSNDITNYNVSGRWKSEATTKAIIYTSEDVHLYDAELILTTGTQNIIEANTPITVYCHGSSYIPRDRVNANVTLVYDSPREEFSSYTGTTGAGGNLTVPHGLQETPDWFSVSTTTANQAAVTPTTATATDMIVPILENGVAAPAGITATVYYHIRKN